MRGIHVPCQSSLVFSEWYSEVHRSFEISAQLFQCIDVVASWLSAQCLVEIYRLANLAFRCLQCMLLPPKGRPLVDPPAYWHCHLHEVCPCLSANSGSSVICTMSSVGDRQTSQFEDLSSRWYLLHKPPGWERCLACHVTNCFPGIG